MRARPGDLSDAIVARALGRWGIEAVAIEHAPVGFGDHHWRARGIEGRRWFVTVAEPARKPATGEGSAVEQLRRAMDTAGALRAGGLAAVVAPERSGAGATVEALGGRYAMSVFAHVEGRTSGYEHEQTAAERRATIELLAALHRQSPPALTPSIPWSPPACATLAGALAELDRPWSGGPYAEPARAAVRAAAPQLRAALAWLDARAAELRATPPPLVVTHGEPHPGNLIDGGDGLRLVDWDTVGLSVPERDLWSVVRGKAELDRYERLTGHRPRPDLIELFRIRWDLGDVGELVGWFRAPHGRDDDLDAGWEELRALLRRPPEPSRPSDLPT